MSSIGAIQFAFQPCANVNCSGRKSETNSAPYGVGSESLECDCYWCDSPRCLNVPSLTCQRRSPDIQTPKALPLDALLQYEFLAEEYSVYLLKLSDYKELFMLLQ